ncbi:MAG TPA: helix-turn-helix transcriptional regulator [Pseudonocardiaceae bacterium]|jgi:transcriptional regulator with XRE-family HTH domain|nr:helix-turn-helix transcriptional regulator [Pseudonocardiaceae bacterium]
MTSVQQLQRPFGDLLRQWREHRRLSQLELSVQAEVSARHLSFVETGRSTPSRDMVIRLSERLDVPLRERNQLLVAAGYAPVYSQTVLESPQMSAVLAAVRRVLSGQEPFPAAVVDRNWNLIEKNSSFDIFTRGADPELLESPLNVLRLALHPNGMAGRIVNIGEWRAHALGRMRRRMDLTADPAITALYNEVCAYPCAQSEPEVVLPGPGDIMVPLKIRDGERELSFFCTVATFGTPLDVTVAELAIETFFPADAETAALLRDNHETTAGNPV